MAAISFDYDPQEIVPVVASFDTDGHIRPLYVRILGNSYKILSHWIGTASFSGVSEYNCKIAVGDYERQILLKYYVREKVWTIPKDTR